MSKIIKDRSELIFLYDVKDVNPNGDPADENKPRMDEETRINIVTDVRLKRTIRDYLLNFKGKEIFVRKISGESGNIQDAKARAKDFQNNPENILKDCIDVRLFGGTIPITTGKSKDSSIIYTGPVQFKMGRSLNKVELKYLKGSGAFASGEGKEAKTFREEWVVPYSIISFYGVINENAAKSTLLTEEDVNLLIEGIWNGTKNLISRSKVGQMPRLLIKIDYLENNYHIGDLDKMIEISSDLSDEQLRDISDFRLDISKLINTLVKNKDKISSVNYIIDDRTKFIFNSKEQRFEEILKNNNMPYTELKM
ncbi:MAG: hypothetical protein APG12_01691 [Candidatus Methanofastidiosum methylothiophilum]|uniref:Type I-B CRISPR-associated protein Cas7/Csh2 n=1 Tax=Candidatus Methanofastidiosum methylothiophilum TaxID=1705564 RepID=A0A150IW19_9EURY|nr:MAG: hypothetical protein APG10_01684 [Candidatus Methanofastidiosum methylthiophilus]KYC46656.1 MAG: hypothetical protein APG11_01749 [Candidatus Methanofastidiosum methylthiophilus]KYC49078.1 MAG: hypothetical protein APG12_01691 [Candidatus Methanofastidiosum methylthiophilus]